MRNDIYGKLFLDFLSLSIIQLLYVMNPNKFRTCEVRLCYSTVYSSFIRFFVASISSIRCPGLRINFVLLRVLQVYCCRSMHFLPLNGLFKILSVEFQVYRCFKAKCPRSTTLNQITECFKKRIVIWVKKQIYWSIFQALIVKRFSLLVPCQIPRKVMCVADFLEGGNSIFCSCVTHTAIDVSAHT